MKKFTMTVLAVSVFFIGLGSLVEKTTANFKSDAQALELISKARIAIGGDANINNVRSLMIAANTENFFEKNGVQENKGGSLEIALEMPNRFSKVLKIGNPEDAANGGSEVNKDVQIFVMKKGDGDNVVWNADGGDAKAGDKKIIIKKNDGTVEEVETDGGKKIIIRKNASGNVLTEDIVGNDKTIILKSADGKVLTENVIGDRKVIVEKDVKVVAGGMRQNEMLRMTLSLLLTAPDGLDVGYFYKGESTVDGFSVNVVEAQTSGSSIKLFLDKSSNLPRMISFMGMDFPKIVKFKKSGDNSPTELIMESGDVGGTVEHQIKYSDYRSINGLLLPYIWTETVGGKQSQNANVTNYEINPANIADKFKDTKVFIRKSKDQ